MDSFVLQIHITGRCNCKCKHCYLEPCPGELSASRLEEILGQYQELIDALQKKQGHPLRPFVNITGGEPFIHPEIMEIMDLMDALSDRFSFRMMSNGTMLTPDILSRLQRLKIPCLQVSLDGDEQAHDALRGVGNFRAVTEGLDKLFAYSIPAKVSFTAHQDNYRLIPEVARICREHHVSALWSDRYVPCGTNSQLRTLTPSQTREYVGLLQAEKNNPVNREANLEILNRRSLQFLASGELPYYCTAGTSALAIDDKGNVYPCRRADMKCGNVFDSSLKDIYETAPELISIRSLTPPKQCAGCRHISYCRGGAKCISLGVLNDIAAKDPGCWI